MTRKLGDIATAALFVIIVVYNAVQYVKEKWSA